MTEAQSMKRLLKQTQQSFAAQVRECRVAETDGQIEGLQVEIGTCGALLSKPAGDFAAVMRRINRLIGEKKSARNVRVRLLIGRERIADLALSARPVSENLRTPGMRARALCIESGRRYNVDASIGLVAMNPEVLFHFRYYNTLSARIVAADTELKELIERTR
jgi:hypothetical protein